MGLIAVASCKKSSSGSNSPIVGKWKITQDATDTNNNGVLDAGEKYTDSSNSIITFNSNNTGISTESFGTATLSANFSWALTNNNTALRIISTDNTVTPAIMDTSYSIVDAITSTTLIVRDTSSSPIQWTIFTKQ